MLLRQLFSVSVVEELCSFYLEADSESITSCFFKPMVNRLEIYSSRWNVSRNWGLRSQGLLSSFHISQNTINGMSIISQIIATLYNKLLKPNMMDSTYNLRNTSDLENLPRV